MKEFSSCKTLRWLPRPLAALGLLLATAGAAHAQTPITFAYTGAPQTYVVPAGVTQLQAIATGASGGTRGGQTGYGARVQATVLVTPGEVLTVLVGGQGSYVANTFIAGGYNGGGASFNGGAGGGATDVRRSGASTGDYLSSRNALVVAGGGGGVDSVPSSGGAGGTPNGGNGTSYNTTAAGRAGGGATQAGPGSGGRGNNDGTLGSNGVGQPGSNNIGGDGGGGYFSCGGGGGYYGGGGSAPGAGAGGGSSWVAPNSLVGAISYSLAATAGNGSLTITPIPVPAPTLTSLNPTSGTAGTSVTITGTNLSGATAVRFGNTAASSFVINSATSITAVVAPGTSTGLVTVTTPGGTATSATPFVVRVAPTTVADTYSTPVGVTLTGNVLTNDLGTAPIAILITRSTNGTLALNPDGSFTYRPNAGFVGTDSFIYYACDPNLPLLCGNPATVTINVVRVAPITVADAYSTLQGVTLTGNVLSNDLGTNPQAILIIRPTRGTLLLNPNGTFTYQPNPGFTGTDSFIYYACNQGAPLVCGDPATVTITVRPANTSTRTANPNAAKPAAGAVGGATIALELALTGHPNPFGDELQLRFSLPLAQAYTLAVYDAQGRLVQQLARGQAEAGQAQQLAVPTHTYAAGLYLVRLTTSTSTRQLKLIKQ